MNWIPVGRVVSKHGMRGDIKFYYYNEVKEEFFRYTSLFALQDGTPVELKPSRATYGKNVFYVSFDGFANSNDVEFLVGKELFVRQEDLPCLEDGEYYEYQLIGLDVVNARGDRLGKVDSMLHTGSSDILVVKGERELMVPMVEGFIESVDLRSGVVRVNEEGLIV